MGRSENIEVFEDTMRLCREHPVLKEQIIRSNRHQKVVSERTVLPILSWSVYEKPATVVVSRKRTLEAASAYKDKISVLNFASATNPGGGVTRGASAQEETICRCSTLFSNLTQQAMWDGFYALHRKEHNPLHNDDCIFTPGVTVIKTDTNYPKLLPESEWYKVDVITCAAPNLRERPGNAMNPGEGADSVKVSTDELRRLHQKRMRRILDVALLHRSEVVILGAFGCGAFQNPPQVVADAIFSVVKEYRYAFRTIELAVYCPPRNDTNYQTFRQVFRNLGL